MHEKTPFPATETKNHLCFWLKTSFTGAFTDAMFHDTKSSGRCIPLFIGYLISLSAFCYHFESFFHLCLSCSLSLSKKSKKIPSPFNISAGHTDLKTWSFWCIKVHSTTQPASRPLSLIRAPHGASLQTAFCFHSCCLFLHIRQITPTEQVLLSTGKLKVNSCQKQILYMQRMEI